MSEMKITVIDGGPYKVEGTPPLQDPKGEAVETPEGRPAYFLCRCGQSGNKPFCDGTHNTLGDWE